MVDNFELIKNFLEFKEGEFYFIQIMQRRKENPELSGYNRLIKSYYVDSIEYLNAREEEIKMLCKAFNARVMITINNVDYLDIVDKLIKSYSTNTKPIFHNIGSITKYLKDIGDLWLFDIDENQLHSLEFLEILLEDFIVSKVPTVTGVHLIVTPFDDESYPCLKTMKDIMLFKNQSVCTLLYYE